MCAKSVLVHVYPPLLGGNDMVVTTPIELRGICPDFKGILVSGFFSIKTHPARVLVVLTVVTFC